MIEASEFNNSNQEKRKNLTARNFRIALLLVCLVMFRSSKKVDPSKMLATMI